MPSVVIEGRWVNSKGQPGGGWSPLVGGKIDGSSWIAQAYLVGLQRHLPHRDPPGFALAASTW